MKSCVDRKSSVYSLMMFEYSWPTCQFLPKIITQKKKASPRHRVHVQKKNVPGPKST